MTTLALAALALALVMASILGVRVEAQYECPLIKYRQSLVFNDRSLLPHSPSVSLQFINTSPLPLKFLDVHYQINGGDITNVRLTEKSDSSSEKETVFDAPLFVLEDTDKLAYRFTYNVDGINLSCDTQTFHVTGKQALETAREFDSEHSHSASDHVSVTVSRPSIATGDHHGDSEVHTAVNERTRASSATVLSEEHVHATPIVLRPEAVQAQSRSTARSMAVVAEESAMSSSRSRSNVANPLNPGICPLIPFDQKLAKAASGSHQYTLSFSNKSPTLSLAFLDVHFAINDGPSTNMRLYTDNKQSRANEARALEGLTLIKGDRIRYSFSYGVNEPRLRAGGQSGAEHETMKVRSCNTEVFTVSVAE